MPKLVFVEPTGVRRLVEAPCGETLMRAALGSGVSGIVADCGGAGCCATCHVHVDPEWVCRIPPPDATELSMLEFVAAPRLPTSRLACQIDVDERLDGLTVTIPAEQIAGP